MRDIIICAWRELTRRKGRTTMSVLGYLLAVGVLVTLITVLLFSRDAARAVLNSTGTHFAAYFPSCASPCYLDGKPSVEAYLGFGGILTTRTQISNIMRLRKISYVKAAAPYLLFRFQEPSDRHTFTVGGFHPADRVAVAPNACGEQDLTSGRFLADDDRGVVLIDKDYALAWNLYPGSKVTVAGLPFTVIGIVRTDLRPAKADMYMTLPDALVAVNRRLPHPIKDEVNMALIEVVSADVQEQAIAAIKKQFGTESIVGSSCYKPAVNVMGMNERSVWLLALLVGFFTLASSMQLQLAAVVERRRDIGILKAVGWADGHITALVLVQSVIQAALGGALGCLLALAIILLVPLKLLSGITSPLALLPNPWVLLLGMVLAVVGGALAGSIPALAAARQRPVDSLQQM
ncbi:MAG: ABC transporter permease [Armatimonadota bacterium]